MVNIFNLGSCAVSGPNRAARAGMSILLVGFAFSDLATPLCQVGAGICATCLMVGAITGWCPTDLFQKRSKRPTPNAEAFGVPTAPVDLFETARRSRSESDRSHSN